MRNNLITACLVGVLVCIPTSTPVAHAQSNPWDAPRTLRPTFPEPTPDSHVSSLLAELGCGTKQLIETTSTGFHCVDNPIYRCPLEWDFLLRNMKISPLFMGIIWDVENECAAGMRSFGADNGTVVTDIHIKVMDEGRAHFTEGHNRDYFKGLADATIIWRTSERPMGEMSMDKIDPLTRPQARSCAVVLGCSNF